MVKRTYRNPVLWIVCGIISLGLAASSFAGKTPEAPKGKISIKSCDKKKGPVEFDHAAHVKVAEGQKQDCTSCHHLVDGKPPTKHLCGDCHKEAKGKLGTCQDMSKKKNPFHINCVGCHKKMKDAAQKPPTSCKGCHKKK